MLPVDESIPETLRLLEMRLATLKGEDTEELAAIGAGLEETLALLPEELTQPCGLLVLCLEMLQEVYLGRAADRNVDIQTTCRAVGALEHYFRSGRDARVDALTRMGAELWQALGRPLEGSDWTGGLPPTEEPTTDTPAIAEAPQSLLLSEDGIIQEFLVESYENLDRLDLDLLVLEQNPEDRETISSIFRTIHTIKGTCGFLGFSRLESLTHAGESLLSLLRDGTLQLSEAITDSLLAMVDAVRRILGHIEQMGREGSTDYSTLTESLMRLQSPAAHGQESRVAAPTLEATDTADEPETIHGRLGDMLISQGYIQMGDLVKALREQESGDPRRLGEILASMGLVTGDIVDRVLQVIGAPMGGSQGFTGDASIRVDVGLLDSLMNLVGELVLTRNQIVQLLQSQGNQLDLALLATSQRLNSITSELQEGVMKTRMQPIGNVWNKFPRVVRDLAHACGKQVRLEMEGRETDLDKSVIEAIKDPLMHLVRNSVDHGIELPEVRVASGKSPEGLLLLRAYHEGGQVNIEIIDDGGGINTEWITAKAIERGFITTHQAARMNEQEQLQLIFMPGFSTSATVTNVSGRGVGMDVVKTNIEKIGGTVDIRSQKKKGTSIRVKIPMTLAIVPALMVSVGEERYAIPQANLLELVRLQSGRTGIERIQGCPIFRLRGKLLPLLFLNQELGTKQDIEDDHAAHIVVLQANDRQFGLVVDGITDTEEIVVKPLSKHLKSIELFAGATIRGDGRVALILDVAALALRANLVAEPQRRRGVLDNAALEGENSLVQSLLLFQVGRSGRMAIPLATVARMEEFPPSMVEEVGNQSVVQYRGQILPLLHLGAYVPGLEESLTLRSRELLQVVVIGEESRSVGMIVDDIIDIVEEVVDFEAQEGLVVGTMVIQGRVTQILETQALLEALQQEHYGNAAPVLHLLPGGESLWADSDSGSRGASSSAYDQGATGSAHAGGADQSARTDRHRNRPPETPPTRRAA